MKLTRLLLTVILLAGMGVSAKAEKRFVYYGGQFANYLVPTTDNEKFYEQFKLLETEEGSNIYEGVISSPDGNITFGDYIFFFTHFVSPDAEDVWEPFNKERICPPISSGNDPSWTIMHEPGTGSYGSTVKVSQGAKKRYTQGTAWRLVTPGVTSYRIRLDMNTGKVGVADPTNTMMVLNSTEIPALTEADTLIPQGQYIYVAPGKCSFLLHDYYTGTTYGAAAGTETLTGSTTLKKDPKSTTPWTFSNWPGGMLRIDNERVTVDFGTGEKAPDNLLYLLSGNELSLPTKENQDILYRYMPTLYSNGNGWEGDVEIPRDGNFQFYDLKSGKVICPANADRNLNIQDGTAYSSYTTAPLGEGHYWIGESKAQAHLTVAKDGQSYNGLTCEIEELSPSNCIYLIGAPSGWNVEHSDMTLASVGDMRYYGAFNIAADEAIFRFYTALGNWDQDSYGSQVEDAMKDFAGPAGETTLPLVEGKGAYHFPDWQGGMMYMLVDLAAGKLTVSDSPIDITPSENPDAPTKLYGFVNQTTQIGLTRGADGLYRGTIYPEYGDNFQKDQELRLFTKLLGVTTDEKEWYGSYAISAPTANCKLEFDKFDVAESSFTIHSKGVSTEAANAFIIPVDPTTYYQGSYLTLDLEKGRMYVERLGTYYLVGEYNNYEMPTYANRTKFANHIVRDYEYRVVDIPAGKFDLYVTNIYENRSLDELKNSTKATIEWDAEHIDEFMDEHGMYYLRPPFQVSDPNWQGGKVLFNSCNQILDLNKANTIYSWTTEDGGYYKEQTSLTDHMNYEFVISTKRSPNGKSNIATALSKSGKFRFGTEFHIGTGLYLPNTVVFDGNTATAPLQNGYGYMFEELDNNDVKVNINLATQTARFEIVSGEKVDSYNIFADQSSEDGSRLYESPTDKDVFVGTFDLSGDGVADEFNFGGADGTVIAPSEGQEAVTFNEQGIFTGSYVKQQAPSSMRRRVASQAAKWVLPEGFNGNLTVMLNEADQTITLLAPDYNKGWFYYELTEATPWLQDSELEVLRKNALRRDADGVQRAYPELQPNSRLMLVKGFNASGEPVGFVTSTANSLTLPAEKETMIIGGESDLQNSASILLFTNEKARKVELAIVDDDEVLLMITPDKEDSIEAATLTTNDAPVEFYNLQGMKVSRPTAGQIYIMRQGNQTKKILIR